MNNSDRTRAALTDMADAVCESPVDPADVVLSSGGGISQAAEILGCRIVQLRASPRPTGPEDGSIYRYDQDALMAAISGTRR